MVPKCQFAVGTDIAEQSGRFTLYHFGCQQSAGCICTDEGVHTVRKINPAIQQGGIFTKLMISKERRTSQGIWIAAGQQIQHGRVAGYDHGEHIIGGAFRFCTGRSQQRADRILNLLAKVI